MVNMLTISMRHLHHWHPGKCIYISLLGSCRMMSLNKPWRSLEDSITALGCFSVGITSLICAYSDSDQCVSDAELKRSEKRQCFSYQGEDNGKPVTCTVPDQLSDTQNLMLRHFHCVEEILRLTSHFWQKSKLSS